jgi:hypothetical protein
VLVSFNDLLELFPQDEVYNILTLSPAAEAELLEKDTLMIFEVAVPESITAFAPKVPVNDHK